MNLEKLAATNPFLAAGIGSLVGGASGALVKDKDGNISGKNIAIGATLGGAAGFGVSKLPGLFNKTPKSTATPIENIKYTPKENPMVAQLEKERSSLKNALSDSGSKTTSAPLTTSTQSRYQDTLDIARATKIQKAKASTIPTLDAVENSGFHVTGTSPGLRGRLETYKQGK